MMWGSTYGMGLLLVVMYAAALLGMGWLEQRLHRSGDAFYVNNRSSSVCGVAVSIVASCVGGSATLGMAGLAWSVGTPAFWWLGSGACGLVVLTVFLARKVRASGARTMPEMLEYYLGAPSRPLASLIIVLAWMAILAAQYSALAAIIASLSGLSVSVALLAGAGLIIAYSMLGGQAAVIRSDVLQCALLMLGLLLMLGYLMLHGGASLRTVPLELVNSDFPASRLSYYLCILGGSYVVCPMLFGRLLSARDTRTAVRGGMWGVVGLVASAVLIVLIGLSCRGLVPAETPAEQVLTTVLTTFPGWLQVAVLLALFSAVISSADSCLLTAATVCANDLLPHRVQTCWHPATAGRVAVLILGLGGLLLAAGGKGILGLLLMANDVYVCGVVAPVFVGMVWPVAQREQPCRAGIMALAMALGGACGLCAALTDITAFSYAGIGVSAVLALTAMALPHRATAVC